MVKRKSQVLTLKQQETLKVLSDFIAEKHYSPSCQKRLVEIKEKCLAAKERRDRQAYDALGEEADYLKKTLKTNEEYFGKKQRIGNDLRNLRRRVSDRIKAALEKIAESDPRLAAHLDSSIVRGVSLVYKPEKNIPWRFN